MNTPDISAGNEQPARLALSAREAAAALGISARTLWTLANRGAIPSVKLGARRLYPVEALREWLAEQAGGR
ncbi:MAG: helix-turn-helix domain-containing protein [Phycisphaerae bacterium]|jgi:excisionase family DNA binding protein